MATGILYRDDCGAMFKIYIPKALLFGELRGDKSVDWEVVDRQELEDGELELVKKTTLMDNTQFVDLREIQAVICPCGKLINFIEILKSTFQ